MIDLLPPDDLPPVPCFLIVQPSTRVTVGHHFFSFNNERHSFAAAWTTFEAANKFRELLAGTELGGDWEIVEVSREYVIGYLGTCRDVGVSVLLIDPNTVTGKNAGVDLVTAIAQLLVDGEILAPVRLYEWDE